MKVHEIIQEGPIWDKIKSGVSKVGAGIAGAKAGFQQGKSIRQGQERITKLAKDAEPYWLKTQAAYQQRGVTPDQMGQYLTQWARKWYNTPTIPDYASVAGAQYSANGIRKYLQTGASYYIAPSLATTSPDQKSPDQKSPEEIRKEKLAAAVRVAQAQMAANQKAQSKQQPQAQPSTGIATPATSNSAIVPRNSTSSSTGGTVSTTNKGVRHVSSPNNPNRFANAKPIN